MFVLVNFTIDRCMKGALVIEESSACVYCAGSSYTFRASREGCTKCEDNAVCVGTTVLVPRNGYWHSSPFSPFMRLCLVMEACSSENRTEKLMEYYDQSPPIQQQLHGFNCSEWKWSEECGPEDELDSSRNVPQYEQCSEGYEGVLCGSCVDGYGHTADGKCKKCNESYAFSCVVVALLFSGGFFVMLAKLAFAVDGVKTETAYNIYSQKANVRDVLSGASEQRRSTSNPGTLIEETTRAPERSVHPRTEIKRDPRQQNDEGTSKSPPSPATSKARLTRSDPIDEKAFGESDESEISPEIKNASGALADTFNVKR